MKQNLTSTRELQTRLNLGEYSIVATQSVTINGTSETFTTEQKFLVAGPRFALEPEQVPSMFPPPNTNGDYNNFLPYITLRRATLPWERQIEPVRHNHPFLALLLISEAEMAEHVRIKSVAIKDFCQTAALIPEPSDDQDALIRVVEAEGTFLASILPTIDELLLTAHVRQWESENPEAVILGNRRPLPNTRYAAHLVSLEGRSPSQFGSGNVQLASLYSWEFTCGEDRIGLVERLKELHCDGLRLPSRAHESAAFRALRREGYVALPRRLAWGDRTYGLYRGPLVPVTISEALDTSCARAAAREGSQGLLEYMTNLGLSDVSFAAAWELGSMLLLRRRDVAMAYHRFRREQSALAAQLDDVLDLQHLLLHDALPELADVPPPEVVGFVNELLDLQGIPFGYLVPDPRLLPPNALRVFQMDRRWLCCLVGGALSPGRARTLDQARELVYLKRLMANMGERSGVLIRSPVVAERPKQTYTLKDAAGLELPVIRRVQLARDVLLLIVNGTLQSIEAQEEPKAAQYGFKEGGGSSAETFEKDLRYPTTFEEIPGGTVAMTADCFRQSDPSVLNMLAIAEKFRTTSNLIAVESHHFALQLIESGAGKMTISLQGAFS